jgi:hypothetical protein
MLEMALTFYILLNISSNTYSRNWFVIGKKKVFLISFIIACVSFSELENDTLNQAELNEIKINENN